MANKIKNNIEYYFGNLEQGIYSYKEFYNQYDKLCGLVYKMWQEDLISDKVKIECFDVLSKYASKAIKYMN